MGAGLGGARGGLRSLPLSTCGDLDFVVSRSTIRAAVRPPLQTRSQTSGLRSETNVTPVSPQKAAGGRGSKAAKKAEPVGRAGTPAQGRELRARGQRTMRR